MMLIIGKKRGIAIYKQDKEIVGYNKKENKIRYLTVAFYLRILKFQFSAKTFLRI